MHLTAAWAIRCSDPHQLLAIDPRTCVIDRAGCSGGRRPLVHNLVQPPRKAGQTSGDSSAPTNVATSRTAPNWGSTVLSSEAHLCSFLELINEQCWLAASAPRRVPFLYLHLHMETLC